MVAAVALCATFDFLLTAKRLEERLTKLTYNRCALRAARTCRADVRGRRAVPVFAAQGAGSQPVCMAAETGGAAEGRRCLAVRLRRVLADTFRGQGVVDVAHVYRARTIREFDERVVVPVVRAHRGCCFYVACARARLTRPLLAAVPLLAAAAYCRCAVWLPRRVGVLHRVVAAPIPPHRGRAIAVPQRSR